MGRYLAYTSPARGHLYPIVPTLLELRERGHEVHVMTLASEMAALRAAGLEAEAIDPAIEEAPLDDWEAATPAGGLARALATFARRAQSEIEDVRRALDELQPDALLIDVTTIGAAAVAEASGLPWTTTIPLFQHFTFGPEPATSVTYVPFGIDPEAGLAVLNGPRREVGLEPLADVGQAWRAPLQLYYTAPPFEDDRLAFPGSFALVGPGVWEPPADSPAWLDAIGRPIVLVGVSSERQGDHALVQMALDALAGDDLAVIGSTAAHDPSTFVVPANARLERWLPHAPILRCAACVICHGGMGIVQKALVDETPLCVVPFGRDQFEVAKRVAACGAGTVVMPDELDPQTLGAAVRGAMTMRSGAEHVGQALARTGGAAAAVDAIEQLAGARGRS